MSKKLIARARNARTSLGESLHFGLCAELADRIVELEQQLAELRGMREEVLHYQREFHKTRDQLAECEKQVTLLRDAMEAAWQDGYGFCGAEGLSDAQKQFQAAYASTEPKEQLG